VMSCWKSWIIIDRILVVRPASCTSSVVYRTKDGRSYIVQGTDGRPPPPVLPPK
jgi:hypothetical protein